MDHGMGQGADRADRADRAGRTDGERYQGMDRRENAELYAAFEALLDAGPEPPLPSVTDAAVAGGGGSGAAVPPWPSRARWWSRCAG